MKPFTVTTRRWEKAVKQWFFSHDGYPFKMSRTGFAQSWFFNSRFASIGTMPEHPKKQAARCTACAFQRHKVKRLACRWLGKEDGNHFPALWCSCPVQASCRVCIAHLPLSLLLDRWLFAQYSLRRLRSHSEKTISTKENRPNSIMWCVSWTLIDSWITQRCRWGQLHTGQLPVVLYDNYEDPIGLASFGLTGSSCWVPMFRQAGKGACLPDSPCYFSAWAWSSS